jgi:hypothetical protein
MARDACCNESNDSKERKQSKANNPNNRNNQMRGQARSEVE